MKKILLRLFCFLIFFGREVKCNQYQAVGQMREYLLDFVAFFGVLWNIRTSNKIYWKVNAFYQAIFPLADRLLWIISENS